MYECECAFYRDDQGGTVLVRPEDMSDTDTICDLRVRFAITAIYPAEPDVGAGMDWNGDIATIEIRTQDWRRWRILRGEEMERARQFLLTHYEDPLWQAADAYAEAIYHGEAA